MSAVMHRLPEAMHRVGRAAPGDIVLTVPVLAEIHFGLARLPSGSRRRAVLSDELARLSAAVRVVLPWTEPAARRFGEVKAALEARGRRIDDMDVAIASIALEIGAPVATCNVKHFARVDDLVIEDWSAP